MNPGELKHRITIQKQSGARDTYGQPLENDWDDFATIWAQIMPLVGKEFFAAETISTELTHKIKMRYKSGISTDMRALFGTRIFMILSVINYKEANIELQLMCRELL